jgi:hypothetical protein
MSSRAEKSSKSFDCVASLIALGSKLTSTPEITERFADRKLPMGRSLGYLLSLVAVLTFAGIHDGAVLALQDR